jgi:hypothetical protein
MIQRGYLDGVSLDLPQLPLLVQGCSRIPQLLGHSNIFGDIKILTVCVKQSNVECANIVE